MGENAPNRHGSSPAVPDFGRAWDSITLTRFLRHLPPGVTVVHDAGDRPLRWVEPSDIDDPTDYLVHHELILTSGFPLVGRSDDAEFVRGFIGRLATAKVSALGFGLDPYFTGIPAAVVEACREFDLTLWEIPAALPFAVVGMAFAKLMEIDGARLLRDNAEANRQLMKCVAGEQPEHEIVTVLASRSRSTVQLFGPVGRLRHFASTDGVPAVDGNELSALLAEASNAQASKLILHQADGWYHLAFPIRSTASSGAQAAPLLGVLQLTFGRDPGAAEHNLMSTAFGLLEVVARQRNLGSFSPPQLATALVLGDRADGADALAPELFNSSVGGSVRRPPRVVLAIAQPSAPAVDPAHAITRLRSLLDTQLVLHSRDAFTAVTRSEPTPQLFARLAEAGFLVAVSRPTDRNDPAIGEGRDGLAGSLSGPAAEASGLLARVREERQSLSADQLPQTFAALLPPAAGHRLARRTLAGVLELPPARRDLYLKVLRAWLAAHGSWDATAAQVELHRNSIRRHITSIGDLLDADLARAETRTELLLALQLLDEPARRQTPQRR